MIYKIGNVKDVDTVPYLTEEVKKILFEKANILTTEYGEDRDIDRDYGGYILYITKGTSVDAIKMIFDFSEYPLEFADTYEPDICVILYLPSTEYAVVLVMSIEDVPDDIRKYIKKNIYEIRIEETLSKTVTIEAATKHEAISIAKKKYKDGEIILTADVFEDVKFEEVN